MSINVMPIDVMMVVMSAGESEEDEKRGEETEKHGEMRKSKSCVLMMCRIQCKQLFGMIVVVMIKVEKITN